MRQQIEYFANLVFYHMFRFEKLTQRIISEPFLLLFKLPVVDRSYKRRGVENAAEVINKALYDKKTGVNVMFANWHFGLLIGLIIIGTTNIVTGLFCRELNPMRDKDIWLVLYIIITILMVWHFSEVLVERKKKYLKYFKQFERKSEQWHLRTAWLAFFTVIGIWGYAIGGVAFYLSRL